MFNEGPPKVYYPLCFYIIYFGFTTSPLEPGNNKTKTKNKILNISKILNSPAHSIWKVYKSIIPPPIPLHKNR